uniref:Uncharacterized protein n=1 Tax=Anguilla anguilla TaxID=7936 RepID=A0A0E9RA28_ANGAN
MSVMNIFGGGGRDHSSKQNFPRSFGLHLQTALFNTNHTFVIGFKSRAQKCHCKTIIFQ